jgi:ABC-type uncharacterized transport system involved in gliding motility auxiliary subunit
MTEGLFILTTIFVAYVVYVIIGDSKDKAAKAKAASAPAKKPKPSAAKPKATKPSSTKPAAKSSAAKSSAAKPAATKKASPSKTASSSKPKPTAAKTAVSDVNELRNPKTDEVSSIAANYRFMKRWIKDALVSEGLLDTVYKNNDIDAAADAKIKAAMEKIKTLDKYKA